MAGLLAHDQSSCGSMNCSTKAFTFISSSRSKCRAVSSRLSLLTICHSHPYASAISSMPFSPILVALSTVKRVVNYNPRLFVVSSWPAPTMFGFFVVPEVVSRNHMNIA